MYRHGARLKSFAGALEPYCGISARHSANKNVRHFFVTCLDGVNAVRKKRLTPLSLRSSLALLSFKQAKQGGNLPSHPDICVHCFFTHRYNALLRTGTSNACGERGGCFARARLPMTPPPLPQLLLLLLQLPYQKTVLPMTTRCHAPTQSRV